MAKIDRTYRDYLLKIMNQGEWKDNRTGIRTKAIAGAFLEHDMEKDGFPILTTKKVAWKTLKVELEGFIKGVTSKKWYQDRGCKIWNEWCNPQKVPYGNDDATKAKMAAEDDLGPIYGFQWRNYDGDTESHEGVRRYGQDQLKNILDTLKTNPMDRRMICSAWNPSSLHEMALPPCHYAWQVTVIGGRLNLSFNMRSTDVFLGAPFNISSYGLLLHLIAKHAGLREGKLIGFFMDFHLYENQFDAVNEQLARDTYAHEAPDVSTETDCDDILKWTHEDSELINYACDGAIKAPVAV